MTPLSIDISVIIPVYQVEDYIIACLQSVINQKVNLECILIDDCGRDASVQRARCYLEEQQELPAECWQIIKHEKNKGLSAARNTGIKAAQGRYIYFLDSDDELLDQALNKLLTKALEKQSIITIGHIKYTKGNPWIHSLDEDKVLRGERVTDSYIQRNWYEMAWNKLILRDFIVDNNLYFIDNLIHEDEVWSLELACLQPSVAAVCTPTYLYRNDREGSIINIGREKNLLKGAYDMMKTMRYLTDVGKKYHLLHKPHFHQRMHDWQLTLLFSYPSRMTLDRTGRWLYYAQYAKSSDAAFRHSYGLNIDWRFRAIALICCLPCFIASGLLQLFLTFWKMRPTSRVQHFLLEQ